MVIAFPIVPKSVQIFLLVHKYFFTCRRQVCFYSPLRLVKDCIMSPVLFLSKSPRNPHFVLTPSELLTADMECSLQQSIQTQMLSVSARAGSIKHFVPSCWEPGRTLVLVTAHSPQRSSVIQQPYSPGSAMLPCFQAICWLHSNTEEFALCILFPGIYKLDRGPDILFVVNPSVQHQHHAASSYLIYSYSCRWIQFGAAMLPFVISWKMNLLFLFFF